MSSKKTGIRAQQADDTRARILTAATQVFAEDGFSGGRIEKISRRARSNDRMIYYYFTSKEQLFIRVLEQVYAEFNQAESAQRFDLSSPLSALDQLVGFVWGYYGQHPEFVSLLNTENLHQGCHARQIENITRLSGEALGNLAPIIRAGQASGQFRQDVNTTHTYLLIASLCYFYHSNLHTLTAFLGQDLAGRPAQDGWLEYIKDQVRRGLLA
ncbi:TetR family transcriptional regulator [Pseudomonas typographi]|uniref:TetR/AcrR family transcriptional regulator n=1 Tax=Pseudomonas typographi TaxID=2715964 RepID=A0ABR7Z6V5_9PSED|nr:TetR family transcriptional regulator [Pseudomonas typographi]MBD1553790.1 TetR/AcrR family transcriptional regulator [Pseudomonas typographi]MBD1588483.1 TetR/AcrR family transcriptional regulator [Pseudomonas typographi]MBD1601185.1 TetR/AcrR family transcriptional regulator [Pseudomonas typographi]